MPPFIWDSIISITRRWIPSIECPVLTSRLILTSYGALKGDTLVYAEFADCEVDDYLTYTKGKGFGFRTRSPSTASKLVLSKARLGGG